MMTLLEIRDEVDVVRNFIECAFHACHDLEGSDPLAAVLDAASDRLKSIGKALEEKQKAGSGPG